MLVFSVGVGCVSVFGFVLVFGLLPFWLCIGFCLVLFFFSVSFCLVLVLV